MHEITWTDVEHKINNHSLDSAQWQSDQKSLLLIVERAKIWGFDPRLFMEPSISNLRTIIREGKIAVRARDRERMAEILEWANTLTVSDLRLKLGTTQPIEIKARRIIIEEEEYFEIYLTKEQFEQIGNSMKLIYSFTIGK